MAMTTQKRKLASRLVPVAAFALLLVALVAVNVLAAYLPLRVDVTEEGLYTLSPGSRQILAQVEEPITLKLYYNEDLPDVPVQFKTYSTKVVELLREYQSAAPGDRVRLERYNPAPDTDDEEWATRYGLSPARLPSGSALYFGLVAVSADREAAVPFLDPRRERFLEYDVSEAIARVQRAERPKLGVLSYLPIGGFGGAPMMGPSQDWAILSELQRTFRVEMLSPGGLIEIAPDIDLLLVVHPKLLPERVSYALDQFVLRGGKLIALVDPNSRLDESGGGQMGAPSHSSLDELFKAWGVGYDKTMIVGDHELATRVNAPQFGVVDYPIWLTLNAAYFNAEQVITAELDEITLIDAGRFTLAEGSPLQFTPLITSSGNSGMVDFTTVRVVNPATISKMVEADGEPKVLAALVTGRFPSAYPAGPPKPPIAPGNDDEAKRLAQRAEKHRAQATADASVLLIGDVDFVADQFSVQQVNFFGNVVTRPVNDNLNFVLNAAEYLGGNQSLIHVRSRGKFSRPFTRVATLQVQAAERYLREEQALTQKLQEVQRQLNEIERQRPDGERLMLSPDQLEAVRGFRLEEQRTRRALRDVRAVLRQDIERLGNTLLAVNLLVVPLLVAGVGFAIIYRRSRRRRGGTP
jgi:ABC-type uncharacterized transport system involved in gliding motility auxiliary subunit